MFNFYFKAGHISPKDMVLKNLKLEFILDRITDPDYRFKIIGIKDMAEDKLYTPDEFFNKFQDQI